ncbi:MAG: hypothetical protein GC152_05675 [Alphaproteobacteria bacterium]|nr:hypothetical protein [Alphaproteobacteria bacterium]
MLTGVPIFPPASPIIGPPGIGVPIIPNPPPPPIVMPPPCDPETDEECDEEEPPVDLAEPDVLWLLIFALGGLGLWAAFAGDARQRRARRSA